MSHSGAVDRWEPPLAEMEWLKERQTGIGGSDVAAIVGIDRYKSPWDVYWSKVIPPDGSSPSEAALWGSLMQEVIAQEWARRYNVPIMPGKLTRMAGRPHVLGTPDYITLEQTQRLVEVKAVGSWPWRTDWAEGGSVPGYYQAQVQWYLAITGLDKAVVVVLVGGNRLEAFQLDRDDNAIGKLLEAADEFWSDHVIANVPPDPDGSAATTHQLEALYTAPVEKSQTILPLTAAEYIKEYLACSDISKQYLDRRDAAANWLREALGSRGADEGLLPGAEQPAVTWHTVREVDVEALTAGVEPSVLAQYSKTVIDVRGLTKALGPAEMNKYRRPGQSRRLWVARGGQDA